MSSCSEMGSADTSTTIVESSNIVSEDQVAIHAGNEPHITVTRRVIDKKTGQILRNASAEFYLEGRSLSGQPRSMWNLQIKVGRQAVLGLAYTAAVVSGVDNIPEDWPEDVRELVSEMAEFRDDCADPVLPLAAQTSADVRYIQSVIQQLEEMKPGQLLLAFRDKNGGAVTEWDDLKNHSRAEDIPQSGIKYCFPSLEVAAIKLCAGRYLEHNWQESVVAGLSGGTMVSFVVIGAGLVLAFVNYRDRKQIKKKAKLDDHMTIQIQFEVDDSEEESEDGVPLKKTVRTKGKLASNRIGVESDFSVLLEKPHKAIFKYASRYGEEPLFIPAAVRIEENARIAELEVKAVHSLCQEGKNPYAEFQEMLLAEDAARAEPRNFLVEDVGCSPHEVSSITQAVFRKLANAGKTPNAEQADILRNAGVARAKFKCILGPPGTGKTTTIAALTEIYVRCPGVGILLCAPSNGNTGRIYDAVSAWMALSKHELDRSTQKPQRVYRVHLEEEYLLKNHDHIGNASGKKLDEAQAARFMEAASKIAADAAWYERQGEADGRKAMNDATTGVTHAIVEAVFGVNGQQAFAAPGRIGGAMVTLKAGINKLKSTPFHKWPKNGRFAFIDAWRTLARALVGRKRIVVCTAGNTVSSLMAEAFSECKHVVIILDEASLSTDPALWNVVVNLFKPERLDSDFSGRMPVRAVVIVGDHHQGKAVIKSETEEFNTFGQQLAVSTFLRAVMTGFPIEGMYEQFRMPEVLCALPNRRCYGGKLRTSAAKNAPARRLGPALRDLISGKFEIDLTSFSHIEDQDTQEFAMDQYLRLQMLNVPSGKCQVEAHTQSRFNMANVDVAMQFFQELVTDLVKGGHVKISEIKILTFYNAQKRRMINALVDLGKQLNLTAKDLSDVVHTSDSFQGQEADIIILDTTVCSYTGRGTLGHVGDELKFNVAATRAKECLFVVGSLNILDSEIIAGQDRVEFVVDLLQTLRKHGSYKDFESSAKPEKIVGAKFDYQVSKIGEGEVEKETAREDDGDDVNHLGNGISEMRLGASTDDSGLSAQAYEHLRELAMR